MFAVLILLTVVPQPLPETEVLDLAERTFQQAAAEREKDPARARELFRLAAQRYGNLVGRGFRNADVYRNQGNARLLGDDLPDAILAYRRGLRTAPNDWAMRANLAYAREQVAYPPDGAARPPADSLPPWWPRLGSAPFLTLALLAYCLGCVALTRWYMTRSRRMLLAGVIALVAACPFGGLWFWIDRAEQYEKEHPLVIITDDGVLLRTGNGLSYPRRFESPLNRGVEARRLLERGDWIKIELGGGETGWVPRRWALVDEHEQSGKWVYR